MQQIPGGDRAKPRGRSADQKNREVKEKKMNAKINTAVERLDQEILKSTEFLRSSMDALMPDCKFKIMISAGKHVNRVLPKPFLSFSVRGATSASSISGSLKPHDPTSSFHQVLAWVASLQISTNKDNQMTINFPRSSGYNSQISLMTGQEYSENHRMDFRTGDSEFGFCSDQTT